MKLGVCYYPEHWPEERWPVDARLMRDAGLSLVRIGEFAWTRMEPEAGRYEWQWLDKAIEILAGQGLQIVLCTPTATPPAWLCYAHPEVLPVDAQGRQRRFGSRRHYCSNNTIYRQYTEKIVRALGIRYGKNPAVSAWQIDNEFGCHDTARCYCERCASAFRLWLKKRYSTLEALNRAWGTDFWSQIYSDWEQIEPPNLTVTEPNPSQMLDYYRFSSDSVVSYQQLQLDILRQHAPGKPVTTNLMGNFPDLDYQALARDLDFVSWDSYPTGYAEIQAESLADPEHLQSSFAYDVGNPYVTGFCHDLTYGLKQAPFWVMEQQAGNINWSQYNTGVRPGSVRLWTWHALASGAEACLYFRWRATRFAQEQYHSGLLKHDGHPDLGYGDVLALQNEAGLLKAVAAQPKNAQVALLLSYEDLWAVQLQPHRRNFGYLSHLYRYYRTLVQLGISVAIVPASAELERFPLLIAPTIYLADEGIAQRLGQYVGAGGNLLFGVRTGFKTPDNLVTDQPLPGVFKELVGAEVRHWQSLPPGVTYTFTTEIPGLAGSAGAWAETLEVLTSSEHTRILARYEDGPFRGLAAMTGRMEGQGKVYYLGWLPDDDQTGALLTWLAGQCEIPIQESLPSGVILTQRGHYTIIANFNDHSVSVTTGLDQMEIAGRDVVVVSLET